MADDKDGVSPTDSGPTSPGLPADGGRNVAVDYIKARYEGGPKPKESPAANVPKVFREPKKLDFQWDKIVDENAKKETGLPVGFKEQDLLQMVFTLTGVDTKSQYLSALETQQPVAKDEKQKAEIESLGDITKSVRRIFESGQIPSSSDDSAGSAAKANEPLNADEIQRGMAKSLLSQWTRIGTDGTSSTSLDRAVPPPQLSIRPTYEQTAGSGVFENQPATLDGVVRSSDQVDEQVIQRGTTRSLLGQWNTINSPDQLPTKNGPSGSRSVKLTYESAPGSGVFENEPSAPRGDVVREVDANAEGEQIQRGFTKSLLSQWQNKGTEDTQQKKYPSKLPIKLVEGEGHIAENEPIRRSDVVRADDVVDEGEQVRRGMAKSLVNEWKTKGTGEFKAERRPINVAEGEGKVLESEPIRRTDVVREDDPGSNEGDQIQRGTTRMLLDQWKSIGTYSRQMSSKERTPIVLAEGDGYVAENEPQARRDDVAREDDASFTETERIQRGLAKSLRSQWQNIGSADAGNQQKERTPININEGEGKVLENEPIRRSDVVRCDDDAVEEVKIERGTTRNLLSQWKNKSNEEFRSVRKSIVLNEDDGRIAENEPTKRPDVVREDDANASEGDQIQRGLARNRLSQWQNKASEEFRPERKSIILAEAEGCVAENEPARRDDVVREMDSDANGDQVQRGLAKSLLSQWKTIGTNEYQVPKRQIVLAEGEERIAENEPIRRTDVIRADDAVQGDDLNQVARGTTKSLLNRWNSRTGSEEPRQERKPIVLAEDEGRVLESEPVRRSDVVREGDDDGSQEGQIQRGTTKSLLQQWKNKPNEETKLERRPIILAEAEGAVCENNPSAQRDDVVRSSSDYTPDQLVVEKGLARNLRQQWTQKGSEEFRKEKTPIVVFEGEGSVAENEPAPRRTDVVREDLDHLHGSAVERGTTRSLLDRWSSVNMEPTDTSPRKKIVIAEDEGRVIENEPIRRTDVVRAEDAVDGLDLTVVRQGTAKNLASQWSNKPSDDQHERRAPINIFEGDGGVSENVPAARRDDVIRSEEDASLTELERIQRGTTKSLLGQWKKIGTEEVYVERKPLTLAELQGEGYVAENEPTVRSDLIRGDIDELEVIQVERGLAKSLLNQWKQKGQEEFSVERKPIVIAEGEGTVAENEPQVRQDVIRENDAPVEETKIQRGIAKTLATQWKQKGSEEFKVERSPIIVAEGEGTVAESEPIRRDDVVRADDYYSEGDSVQRGLTKNLLEQWKTKGTEEFRPQRKSIIIAEGEGYVAENEPIRRDDVVRSDDPTNPNETVELPQRGQARQLREQWATLGTSGGSRDATPKPPINIYEESPVASTGSSGVIENQPAARRTDVVREDDEVDADLIALRRGNVSGGGTRQVRGYWTAPRQEQSLVSREKLELEALRASGTWATGSDAAEAVFENEPVRLEGVVRAGDPVDTGPSVERGIAKQLVNRYLSQPSETTSKQPFRLDMDVNLNEASVYENQPVQLQGVTRSSEQVEDVIGLRGQARNLAQRYATAASVNDDGSKKPPEMIKIDLADGPSVLESTPAELPSYVVRSDDYQPDAWKAGLTRDMLARWNSQRDLEGASGAGGVSSGGKPAWQLELEMTPQGSGVFENEPVVRSDVIREDDRAPDMIPVRQTRRTRAMWSRREREELEGPQVKEAPTREMIRFTPPRERSPPAVCATDEPFKSVQRITLQSSGTSTPSRSETQARGGGTGRAGTVTPGTSSSGVHSPQISQPGTPGATGLPPTPSNWAPSATDVATSARNRARISDEVMQWHARRLSRSVSIEENMALTGALTSSMTSPTSGTPAAPGTPTSDRTFNGGDWAGHYEQQSHQQPVVQQVESHYQSSERQQPEDTAAPQQNGNGISSIHDDYVISNDGAMANQYAVRYSDDAQTTSSAGSEYIDSGSYSVTAATAAAINSTPYGDYGSQNYYQHQQPSHQEQQQQHQQTFQWLPETGSSNVVGNGTNSAYGDNVTNDYAPNQYDDTANQQQQLQPQFPSYDTLTADDIDKYYRTYDEQTQSQYNYLQLQPQQQQPQQQQPQQYHDTGVDGYNSSHQYDPYGGYQTSQPQNNSTFQYPSTDYYQGQPLDQGQGQYYDQGQGQGHYYDQDRGQQYDQGQVQYYDRDQYDYQYQQYQVPQQLTADDQYQPSTVKSSATLVFKPSSSTNTSGFN